MNCWFVKSCTRSRNLAYVSHKYEEVGSSAPQVVKKNSWSGVGRQNEQRNGEAKDRNGETGGNNNKDEMEGHVHRMYENRITKQALVTNT